MNAGRKPLEPAYVIHSRAYGDTSVIVELITAGYGRLSVLARGAKRGKAQKSLLLQPFRSLHVSWTGRGELPVLTAAEEAGNVLRLQGEALVCGYYINELIYLLLPKYEPVPEIFAHYWPTLLACVDDVQRSKSLRQFEITLLEQLGLAPMLTADIVTGQRIQSQQVYRYRVPEGPVAQEHANGNGVEISGASLLGIAAMDFSLQKTEKEARNLTRALIHYHLDGREIKSRTLFKELKKLSGSV